MERRHAACLGAALLLLICWIVQAVLFFGSDPDLLALSLSEAAATIDPPDPSPTLRLAVFAPSGDESGAVEKELRKRFDGRAGWKLLDRELQEEALRDYAQINPHPRTAAEAVAAGKKLGVEAAFFADVSAFKQDADRAQVALKWGLVRVPMGDNLGEGAPAREMAKGFFSLDRYRARVDGTSSLFRTFLWVVTLLVLPVALLPVNELALGLRTNAASAALLAGYAVINFVLLLLLNGFRLISVFWGIAALAALAVSALYTLAVLNAAVEE